MQAISSGTVTHLRLDSSSSHNTSTTSLMNSLHNSTITGGRTNEGMVDTSADDSDIFSLGTSTIIGVNKRPRLAGRSNEDTRRIIPEEFTTF